MRRIVIATLAVVLVSTALIGGGIGLAVAQDEDTAVQTFLGRVAEKLGIGEDELRSAMTEAQEDIIDERVAAGDLTAEQGERLKERVEEKGLLGPRGGSGIGDRFCDRVFDCIGDRIRDRDGRLPTEAAAAVLDMEPEELLDELKDGKTVAEVAEEQGMTVDEFTAALLAEVQQELDALVAEGKLTEEQANTIYERIEENIDRIVNDLPQPHGLFPRGASFQGGALGPGFEHTETNIEA